MEVVGPLVDGGAFTTKATVGEPVTVTADVFADGHDRAAAALRYPVRAALGRWSELPICWATRTLAGAPGRGRRLRRGGRRDRPVLDHGRAAGDASG